MKSGYLFIEAPWFTEDVMEYFSTEETYARFQSYLMDNPDAGSVMPGVSPLRKIRWSDARRSKGKRGGIRVIYLHISSLQIIYLITAYSNDESEDLSPQEKKEMKSLAAQLVKELHERYGRGIG